MSRRKRILDYVEVYLFLKSNGKERALQKFGYSLTTLTFVKNIGDDFQKYYNKKNGIKTPSTLDEFTPRQLMEELVKLGYKGTLTYTNEINLENL